MSLLLLFYSAKENSSRKDAKVRYGKYVAMLTAFKRHSADGPLENQIRAQKLTVE